MATMRPPGPIRSLRQSIQQRDAPVSRTEVLEDQPHIQSLEQFLPQIAAETEQAVKTERVPFHYFRRKRTGRRCSCFQVETSPEGQCQICYGTGFVGGWDMHGCRSEWFDVTRENLRLVNCKANYNAGTRPVYFTLEDGATQAFVDADFPLVRSIKKTQYIQLGVGNKRKGSAIVPLIKAPADSTFVPLTEDNLNARLGESSLALRIQITRNNTSIPSPRLSHLLVRYRLIPKIEMFGDMNLGDNSFELGDLGFFDTFTMLNLVLPKSFDHVNNEDFLVRQTDQKRFKVTKFQRNAVSGILLSHTVMARLLIPGTDSLIYFPC
jgi:hypothetical protein